MHTRNLILLTMFATVVTVTAAENTPPFPGNSAVPAPQAVQATTLEYSYKGQTLKYLVDANGTGVTVAAEQTPAGAVTIPATITVDGRNYTVTGLEENAFYSAMALTSLTIEATFNKIDKNACAGCKGLTAVSAPNVMVIGEGAFSNCSQLKSTVFSSSLYYVGIRAFYGCSSLEAFTFPKGIRIMNLAFNACTGLTSLDLDADEIGLQAFYGCTGLRTATIKSKVIGNNAFTNCSGLHEVHLKSSPVSNSASSALSTLTFAGCTGTLYIECELPSTLTFSTTNGPLINSRFEEVNVSSSYVPANLLYNQQFVRRINLTGTTDLGGNPAPQCYSLGAYSVEGSNLLTSYEGCIYSADLKTLQYVPAGQHCIIVNGACTSITAPVDTKKTHYMDLTALGGRTFSSTALSSTAKTVRNVFIRETDRNTYTSNFGASTKFIGTRPRFDVDGNNAANVRDIRLIIDQALKEK